MFKLIDLLILFFIIFMLMLFSQAIIKNRIKKFENSHEKFGTEKFHFEINRLIDESDIKIANEITAIFIDIISEFTGVDANYLHPDMNINDLLHNKLIRDDGDIEDIALKISKKAGCDLDFFESITENDSFKNIIVTLAKNRGLS